MSTPKLNLYNAPQLRTIVDENLSDVLGSLGYTESFLLTDIKLGLGLVTVALAGSLFLIEKKLDFFESINLITLILVLYFIASGAILYLTVLKKYKNIKYIGYDDKNNKITIITESKKFEPIYSIEIRFGEDEEKVVKTQVEFMKLFDTFTAFHAENLKEIIGEQLKISRKKSQ